MSKHTSAPWESTGYNVWAKSPLNARVRIAEVSIHAPMNGIDWQANARLIAAAPDMHKALELAAGALQALHDKYKPTDISDDTASDARYALLVINEVLTKARGQA